MDVADVKRRLGALSTRSKASVEAARKSLRSYPTSVHPLLHERLSIHWPEMSKPATIVGASIEYSERSQQFRGNTFVHYFLSSFYEQEIRPGQEITPLTIRLSSKTDVGIDSRVSTVNEVLDRHSLWAGPDKDGIVSFNDLILPEVPRDLQLRLFDDFGKSIFSEAVQNLLLRNNFTFPVDDFVSIPIRDEDSAVPSLIMKEKYYAGRDDNRAY